MTYFIASFEDAAKITAIAEANDEPTDGSDAFHDIAQLRRAQTARRFAALDDAVSWGRERVKSNETFYGVVEVRELEGVSKGDRCKYCTCQGVRLVRYHHVSEDGVDETIQADDDCAE